MADVAPASVLVGRDVELKYIADLAAGARENGAALVVRGAPGVGKSALLNAAAHELETSGWRVLRTSGAPAETELRFSGLYKLVRPVREDLSLLPVRHQEVLRGALGLTDAHPADLAVVADAVMGLLAHLARGGPVSVLVDDAQWLDAPTSAMLAMIALRLDTNPILLLAGGRDFDGDPLVRKAGIRSLGLEALDESASENLLASSVPGLARSLRDRILELAAGNPLALTELPKGLRHIHDEAHLGEQLPMTERLERAFGAPGSELPQPVADLLLIIALNDSDSLAEAFRAAETLHPGTGRAEAEIALSAGLICLAEDSVRFCHPLVRCRVTKEASVSRRHAAHRALAGVLAAEPDRAVRHVAASVVGVNEQVAAALEDAASRAHRGGAMGVAATALRRAAQLSDSSAARGRRLLRAAELEFDRGHTGSGMSLLRGAERLELSAADRLRAESVRELNDVRMAGGSDRVRTLVDLAQHARRSGDIDVAARFLRRAAWRCWAAGGNTCIEAEVLSATDRLGLAGTDPRRLTIRAHAAPFFASAEIIQALDADDVHDATGMHHLAEAATCVRADRPARDLSATAVEMLRREGRLTQLSQALLLQAHSALRCGNWNAALAAARECAALSEETRQSVLRADALSVQAMARSLLGDIDEAHLLATAAEALILASATPPNATLAAIQHGRAMAAVSAGRPAEAFDQLWRIFRSTDPAYHQARAGWALASLAEFAVQSGNHEKARSEVTRFAPLISVAGAPALQARLCFAEAVLAVPEDAEARFKAALAMEPDPFLEARSRLAYGGWLRRQQRTADSRSPLREARDAFGALGASAWAEQARDELRAGGDTDAPRLRPSHDRLTAQEALIAGWVGDGFSNREIAQRLNLSPRTVDSHLYRIFRKLGITSRTQLVGASSPPRS